MSRPLFACVVFVALLAAPAAAAEVRSLQTQKVGDVVYFRLVLAAPREMDRPKRLARSAPAEALARWHGRLPRLAPLDGHTRTVHLDVLGLLGDQTDTSLIFLGRRVGDGGPAKLRLSYPVAVAPAKGLAGLTGDAGVALAEVSIDWTKAAPVKGDDLVHRWATAQAHHFRDRHVRSSGLGYFATARRLTERQYDLLEAIAHPGAGGTSLLQSLLGSDRFFELTTGATALTETLALGRMTEAPPAGKRTRPVARIRGIDIAEHPWKKMMGGKKPADEPLARLVPHDNWYFTAHHLAAIVGAWEVLDTWGGSVLRSPQMQDRDQGVRARYEGQLCLPSVAVLRAAPAGLVRGIALTGSDLFWAEGSDVTVLLDVSDPAVFRKAQLPFLAAARLAHGKALKERTEKVGGVSVESFLTPHREVSLYRAALGRVVVLSNSPAAMRRVIDTHQGRGKALADALDFQYMRTVFVRDAKEEDGFAFLSDAFVRRLVGPATRIKAMRRHSARAALTLASHAALYVGHDTGRLPVDTDGLLMGAGLKAFTLEVPEGAAVAWDASRTQAISEAYNTLEFSTPLVELPIDQVTADEERAYDAFRQEYLNLWRRFFDPVGIRFRLGPGPLRLEVYLLPLVNTSVYNDLRRFSGGGTVSFSPAAIPASAVFRFLMRLDFKEQGIGDWAVIHLDGRALNVAEWVRRTIRADLGEYDGTEPPMPPLFIGVGVKDAQKFESIRSFVENSGRPVVAATHRGVNIRKKDKTFLPSTFYFAEFGGGFYLSWSLDLLQRRIDEVLDAPRGKAKDAVEANASLHLAPPGGANAQAVMALLEWETHKLALSAVAAWQALYDGGAVTARMTAAQRAAVARRLLGFVPASPDATPFDYDEKLAQVRNRRHGTLARPTYHAGLSAGASVLELFSQVRSVRADLRFREDGIHTVLTLDWAAAKK